jgi:hypothetical protein
MHIDCDFPGGNILVEKVDGDDVYVHQELRDTDRDWFYWCFRIRGAEGRNLRFHFTRSRALTDRGPAVSTDGGVSWHWLGAESMEDNTFRCTIPSGEDVRFSFAMPYQLSNWNRFIAEHASHPALVTGALCTTRKGREVPFVRAGCIQGDPEYRVALTSRHHCCEMMADYVLEGLLNTVLAEEETGAWFRSHVELLVVPFADLDGVEDGDQGKGRIPHDHGRDYAELGLYPTPRAIREKVSSWANGRLVVAIDIHCPWLQTGPVYLVGQSNPAIAREQNVFSRALETAADGALGFAAENFLPFGQKWNTQANYTQGKGFSHWASELDGIRLGTSIEIPYANADGHEVNQSTARDFGAPLAIALREYLQSGPVPT